MTSPQEKAHTVTWFIEFKSTTQVQCKFWTTHNRSPALKPTMYEEHERFLVAGSVLPKPKSSYLSKSYEGTKWIKNFHIIVLINQFAAWLSNYKQQSFIITVVVINEFWFIEKVEGK